MKQFEELHKQAVQAAKKVKQGTGFSLFERAEQSVFQKRSQGFVMLSDRNLIYEIELPAVEKLGSLVLPETALSGKVKYGLVILAGPGYHSQNGSLVCNELIPGDVVVIPPHANNQEMKIGDVTFQVYRTPEIISRAFTIKESDLA